MMLVRKALSGVMLGIVLASILTLAFNVQPVRSDYVWTETIYIRSNGSVEPLGAPISTVDNVTYRLTDNINVGNVSDYTKAIVVERDNIVLDGANHRLFKDYYVQLSTGIYLSGRSNVTIERVEVWWYWRIGIYVEYSDCINISRNDVYCVFGDGVQFYSCSDSIVSGNNMHGNEYHAVSFVSGGSNNSIYANRIVRTYSQGVFLGSSGSIVAGNDIRDNYVGILIWGSNNVISGNNVTGPHRYGIECHGSYNVISGNNVTDNLEFGMIIWPYPESSIHDNSISGNIIANNRDCGIGILGTTNHNVSGNLITGNGYGIRQSGSNNSISGNNVTGNSYGVGLGSGSNNRYWHNNFIANTQQIVVAVSGANVWDDDYPSGGNYWSDYTGVDVKKGSSQDLPGSDGLGDTPYIIDANNRDRYPLVYPHGSSAPSTFALTITAAANGTTDPTPGTYTYYVGQNVPVQAIPNTDYALDHWELDAANVGSVNPYSVLMDQNHTLHTTFRVGFHDVAVTNVTVPQTILPQGYSVDTGVRVENQGDFTETFNVTLIANTTEVDKQEVTLASGNSTTLTFTWNTTGFDIGNYTISTVADVLMNETDTVDNTYVDGVVMVILPVYDIAVTNITTSKAGCLPMPTVGQGYNLTVSVTVRNLGSFTETFNITLYANATIIATLADITLTSGDSTTLTFTYNTAGWAYGNCTTWAYATPIEGETNTSDNTFVDGWIIVTIAGDINGDSQVDLFDAILLAGSFGSSPVSPYWNPNADINGDNIVDLFDAIILAGNFGNSV